MLLEQKDLSSFPAVIVKFQVAMLCCIMTTEVSGGHGLIMLQKPAEAKKVLPPHSPNTQHSAVVEIYSRRDTVL